jgi:hypothetical protein
VIVLSPYRLRPPAGFATKTNLRCRIGEIIRLLIGAGILIPGLKVC